jgi:hypothetical protein
MINCTSICEAVCKIARFAASLPRPEQLELELRLSASAAFFYRQFGTCTRLKAFDRESAAYAGTRSFVARTGNKRLRTDYAERGQRLLGASVKERIGTPCDFAVDQGRLRVDLARETASEPTASDVVRYKQRVSFRLRTAPLWRVDFTRVVCGDVTTHEIEVELDAHVLSRCRTPDDAERLARQAALVLAALGITTPPTAQDEIECE